MYGKDIWKLISFLQDEGFEVVMILGEPGKIVLFNCARYKLGKLTGNSLELFLLTYHSDIDRGKQ